MHNKNIQRILNDEIEILKPTHVIFFGYNGYETSFYHEVPDIYEKVNLSNKLAVVKYKGIKYFFTIHPGAWKKDKPKDYENKVIKMILNNL